MSQVFDSAVTRASAALALAQTLANKDIQIRSLLVRASAKQQKAIWAKLNGASGAPAARPVATPLVADAGAVADAQVALALIGPGLSTATECRSALTTLASRISGMILNQRLELHG